MRASGFRSSCYPLRGPTTARAGEVDRQAAIAHARQAAERDRRRLARSTFLVILAEAGAAESRREGVVDRLVDHLEAIGLELRPFR